MLAPSHKARLVSVIIGTRDRPEMLREALASIRAIEGPDLKFEILVGDNGTSPETPAIVAEFGGIYGKTAKNGCAAARNLALARFTGEFVAFLDDDDVWLPENIRPQIALMDARTDLAAVFGQIVSTDASLRPTTEPWPQQLPADERVFETMLSGYFPQVGATVVRGSVARSIGLMDEALIGDSDWDWQLRIARNHRIGFVPTPVALFRQRPPGSYDTLQRQRLGYTRRIFLRHALRNRNYSPKAYYSMYQGAVWTYYDHFVRAAAAYAEANEYVKARRAVASAFKALPTQALRSAFSETAFRTAILAALGLSRRRGTSRAKLQRPRTKQSRFDSEAAHAGRSNAVDNQDRDRNARQSSACATSRKAGPSYRSE
jgi:glycosyltransferase involved in cell wall biosynthesis